MKSLTKFLNDVSVTTDGLEISSIIKGPKNHSAGVIEQIIVYQSSGSGTTVDVEIRYESGSSDLNKLVYSNTGGILPNFIDSSIGATFDVRHPDLEGDLYLYLNTDGNSVFQIRIDMTINS